MSVEALVKELNIGGYQFVYDVQTNRHGNGKYQRAAEIKSKLVCFGAHMTTVDRKRHIVAEPAIEKI